MCNEINVDEMKPLNIRATLHYIYRVSVMYASNANTCRNDTQTMVHPLVHYAHLAT